MQVGCPLWYLLRQGVLITEQCRENSLRENEHLITNTEEIHPVIEGENWFVNALKRVLQ